MKKFDIDSFMKDIEKYFGEDEAENKESATEPEDDVVNHPKHYANTPVECIDAMRYTFGDTAVYWFCICNVFKYFWRRHEKDLNSVDKAGWYFDKAKELLNEAEEDDDSDWVE